MREPEQFHGRLTRIFRDNFERQSLEIHDHLTAKDIVGWDSLMHVNLVVSIEDEFDVKFTTAEIASFTCIGDVKKAIRTRVAA